MTRVQDLQNAPNSVIRGEILVDAHGRVYKVLNELIDDPNTSKSAKEGLVLVRETFSEKARVAFVRKNERFV